jgi:hypothetical protein
MEQENPFYTRKHCEIKRITNVPDRATARRGGAQLVNNKLRKLENGRWSDERHDDAQGDWNEGLYRRIESIAGYLGSTEEKRLAV